MTKLRIFALLIAAQAATSLVASGITPPYERCPTTDCSTFSAQADLLYWSAWQSNLEYTWKLTPVNPGSQFFTRNDRARKSMGNEWDLGFRVGAGYVFNECGWGLSLLWTDFSTKLSGSTETDTTILSTNYLQAVEEIPVQFGGYRASEAQGFWKLDYDTLTFNVGREYYISSCLHFHPEIGVEFSWIRQKLQGAYSNVFAFPENPNPPPALLPTFIGNQTGTFKKDTWGVGPNFQWASFWQLGCDFQILAEVAGALLWMDVDKKFTRTVRNNTSNPTVFDYEEVASNTNRGEIWPTARLAIGLDWTHCFCSCCTALELQLKYEVLYWWESSSEKFSLNGLTFSGGVHF